MKIIKEFAVLITCLLLGVFTKKLLNLPVPEAIYGMAYLFLGLIFKIIKAEDIATSSNWLLDNMAFFLVPLGVEIIVSYKHIEGRVLVLILSILASLTATMIVTGLSVQFVQERRNKDVR